MRLAHCGEVAEADPIPVAAAGPDGHLQRQPGFPHTSRPMQGDQPRLPKQPGDGREILVPPDEAGHWNRQRRRPVRDLTMRIRCTGRVAQDVLFDLPQRRRGIQPEFLGQVTAPRPEGGQGFGVAARPVEGLHEQSSRLLSFRVFRHERLQRGDSVLDQVGNEQQFGPAFRARPGAILQPGRRGQRERPAANSPATGPRHSASASSMSVGPAHRWLGPLRPACPQTG